MLDEAVMPPSDGGGDNEAAEAKEAAAVGYYQRSDEDLISYLRACFKEAYDGISSQRPKRTKDWKMYAGDHWEQTDIAARDRRRQPTLTLNLLLSIISAVEGEERTNRQEMKFYGEGQEDDGAAYGLNRILKWVMDQCGGEFSLSQMFRSLLVCGEGWVVPDMDFFDDPEGLLRVLYVDDEEMFDDPLSRDPTSADSRYCHRVRYMREDEGEARWPGFRQKVRQQGMLSGAISETDGKGYRDIYSTPDDVKSLKLFDQKKQEWAVTETWWSQIEPGWVVVDEASGLLVERSEEEVEALKMERENQQQAVMRQVIAGQATFAPSPPPEAMAIMGAPAIPSVQMPPAIQAKQRPVKRFYMASWCGSTLLDKMASPLTALKRIPYVPARGLYDKAKREWFGLTRPLIDTQNQHNVEQSTIVQLMQLMPKQAWYGPKGSFHDKNAWQEKIAQPGAMLEYNAARGKPEPIPVPPIPRHLVDMAFTRPQTMREISGVNVEMTGQRVASDPGVVMEMRQKAARTVLAPMFDNYRMAKKALGVVLLSYVQTYVSVGRRIRVLGPEGASYVEVTKDMTLGRYDVTVEETNSTLNDRIATLNVMQTTLPQLAKAGLNPPPEVIDLLPMQPHIRDAWKRQMAWQMTVSGQLPPPDWQPGMPVPLPTAPLGSPPPAPPPTQ